MSYNTTEPVSKSNTFEDLSGTLHGDYDNPYDALIKRSGDNVVSIIVNDIDMLVLSYPSAIYKLDTKRIGLLEMRSKNPKCLTPLFQASQ